MNDPRSPRPAPDGTPRRRADAVRRDTIVVGASAGGVAALRRLLGALPATLPAAVLVVLHQASEGGELAGVLGAACRLPVQCVDSARAIREGIVYVAPPDRHMVVARDEVRPVLGPLERHTRPAINPLFRTAAATRGARVIAVQLTGRLDDGVAGLVAVGRCGGLVLVQDPDEAAYPEMPRGAIDAVAVDHVAPVDELAARLNVLVHELAWPVAIPPDVALEARLAGGASALGGDEDLARSLLVAIQGLADRVDTLNRMAASGERQHPRAAAAYRERAGETAAHVERLRRFLLDMSEATAPRTGDDTLADAPSPDRPPNVIRPR